MSSRVENIYAEALFSLAVEEGNEPAMWEELRELETVMAENPEYTALLSAPSFSKQEKHAAILQAFEGKLPVLLCDFLCLLADKDRLRNFEEIFLAYRDLHNTHHGFMDVTVTTAFALDQSMRERIAAKLGTMTGKEIILHERLDSEIIGGIVVEYEGTQIDMSVKQKLENMKSQMRSAPMQ